MATRKGSLIIAGSGIASVGHITLETLSCIRNAEKIYYLVTDPVTEAFIVDTANETPPNTPCVNLHGLYGKTTPRYDTYVQISEVLLNSVRAGHSVLCIFYGHPGVFVSPSHRAVAIAIKEGYNARILPGVSAEDCLFADLRVDPAIFGCASYEATELLLRRRPLDTTMHNIIWQVGSIGVLDTQFGRSKLGLLMKHLNDIYGGDHRIVHYVGAVLPQANSTIEPYAISDLLNDRIGQRIRGNSTFYIPPLQLRPTDSDMMQRLGFTDSTISQLLGNRFPPQNPSWAADGFPTSPAYGDPENQAIAKLPKDGSVPEADMVLVETPAARKFMIDIARDPKLREEYVAGPQAAVANLEGITDLERFALGLGRVAPAIRVLAANRPVPLVLAATPPAPRLGAGPETETDITNIAETDPESLPPPLIILA